MHKSSSLIDLKNRNLRVAVLLGPRLGDSLMMMTVAQNLRAAGIRHDIFGDYMVALADWFPGFSILPSLTPENLTERLSHYDVAVQIHDYWPYRLSDYGIPDAAIHNGLQPLNPENARSQPQRVIIHTSSTEEKKNWCFRRFIRLGKALQHRGYEPIYILGPDEAHLRAPLLTENLQAPLFPSLSALTAYVQTAGWHIGNDSGIGHLASNLGIPTLTVTSRGKSARINSPGWAPSHYMVPRFLPTAALRNRFWRQAITVRGVLREFGQLQDKARRGQDGEPQR